MMLALNDGVIYFGQEDTDTNKLHVKARNRKHLTNILGDKLEILETPQFSFPFRTVVSKTDLAAALTSKIQNVHYHDYKDSCLDNGDEQLFDWPWTCLQPISTTFRHRVKHTGNDMV